MIYVLWLCSLAALCWVGPKQRPRNDSLQSTASLVSCIPCTCCWRLKEKRPGWTIFLDLAGSFPGGAFWSSIGFAFLMWDMGVGKTLIDLEGVLPLLHCRLVSSSLIISDCDLPSVISNSPGSLSKTLLTHGGWLPLCALHLQGRVILHQALKGSA